MSKSTHSTDIAELAAAALSEAVAPEKVKEIVERKISETVKRAVEEAVSSYSSFGRDLEKKISAALSINNLNLPAYNNMISGMVEKIVEENVSELIAGRLKSDLSAMLKIAPKTIKLSKIVENMLQGHEDDGAYGDVVTCHVEVHREVDDFFGPTWHIYLDDSEHLKWNDRQSAEVKISVSHGIKKDRKQSSTELNTGKIYSVINGGHSVSGKNGFTTSKVYGLANIILAYYAAETVIEIDEDEVVTSVGDY